MLQDSCFTPGIMALEEAGQYMYIYVWVCVYIHSHTSTQLETVCAELQCCSLSLCMDAEMDLLLNFPEVWRWTFSVKAWLQQSKSWHWLAGILTEDTPGCPLPQLPGLHPTACLVKAFISCEWPHYIVVDRSSPASFWITTSKSLLTVSLNCHSLRVGRGMLFK